MKSLPEIQRDNRLPCILAIDPALSCGWAAGEYGPGAARVPIGRGTWSLVSGPRQGERFRSLYAHLREVLSYTPITHLAYETCYFRSRAQMESHTGFITTIQHFAAVHELDLLAASPVEIKVEAGYGRADKEQMMRAAEKRWSVRPRTHDEADALILLSLAISRLKFKARLAKAASR